MKRCSRCGANLQSDQIVCPNCGKHQRRPRKVRCRTCGTVARRSLTVCPGCGEPLRADWLRPILLTAGIVAGLAVLLLAGVWLRRTLGQFKPAEAISTVQAIASEVPVLVEVPTLTPTLTPSVTPSPTTTPTPTPTPTLTPTPTPTPSPTLTPTPTLTTTPSPTATRPEPAATATPLPPTATAAPTASPPTLAKPESGSVFSGENARIELVWSSNHTLRSDECFQIIMRWTEKGLPVVEQPQCIQGTSWYVDKSLYLRADQVTERVYFWSVRLARRGTDANGNLTYLPFSPSSEERSFFWK